eukprot:845638-Prymnesium_polylepis.1
MLLPTSPAAPALAPPATATSTSVRWPIRSATPKPIGSSPPTVNSPPPLRPPPCPSGTSGHRQSRLSCR